MTVFKTKEDLFQCIGGLFDWARETEEVAAPLAKTGLIIQLNYTEPDAIITVDCRDGVNWSRGASKDDPDVQFFMRGDIGHKFWMGHVNLLIALAKRDIKSKGPLMKVMKLLPKLKPLYKQYPAVLEKVGRGELAAV